MSATIRQAHDADLAALRSVEEASDALFASQFPTGDWGSAPSGTERAAWPGFILVAAETETVVGFVHVIQVDDETVHLEQLSVLPEHGRRGIGRALVEAAQAEAERRGHHRMTLRTFADVPWNGPFYMSCGFRESAPDTPFHRGLIETETREGLHAHGRRVQMSIALARPPGSATTASP